eukprot:jgi/Mesen1/8419/ME000472S07780
MGLCGPSKQALAAQVAAPGVTKSEVEATDPADRAAEVPSQNKTFPTTTAAAAAEGGRGAAAAQADRRAGTEEPHVAIFDLAAAQTQRDAAALAKHIVRAIDVCHRLGVVHRDLKPENFLFTSRSDDAVLKVTDFGMAALFRPGQKFDRACGSAMYMAPEVVRLWRRRAGPKVGYGPEVDIFGAGVIMFILLVGEHPFPPPPHERSDSGYMRAILRGRPSFGSPEWKKISMAARELITSMLCLDPKGRPTAAQVLSERSQAHIRPPERDAAALAKHIVRAIDVCHRLGVVHRDLKPENFLFTSRSDDAVLKVTDFGMAALFRPGQKFDRACGSAMYMAPEVVRLWRRRAGPKVGYGPEVDIFGAGVIMFILLVGEHPFPPPPHERSDSGYMRAILRGRPSFGSPEWKKISMAARELITSMLCLDPKGRPTAAQVLSSAWIREAPDEPLDLTVVRRFKHFIDLVMLKRIKKVAMRAMAETLSEAEVACVRQLVADADAPPRKTGLMSVELLFSVLQAVGADKAAAEVAKVFEETGVSKTASFEYAGFLEATAALAQIAQQENLFKGLSLFDEDLSGYITEDELKRACAQFRVDEKSMRELILEVNRDDTGRIDYNEFVAMMRKETGGLGRKIVEGNSDLSLKEMQEAAESMVVDS